jgi:hypothetical protein
VPAILFLTTFDEAHNMRLEELRGRFVAVSLT